MNRNILNKSSFLYEALILIFTLIIFMGCTSQQSAYYGKLDTKLFLSDGEMQPLVVGFGGSEGGNIYAQDETQELRQDMLNNGFAFLAVGYFGSGNTPTEIDRISLSAIYDTINSIAKHPKIDRRKIALIGGSRGGELILNLGSQYKGFNAIISMVAPNFSLPSRFGLKSTSSWTNNDEEIPNIQASNSSVKKIREGNFYRGIRSIIEENENNDLGKIKIENIDCPLFIISAKEDEVWPSTIMAEQMVKRLAEKNFKHEYRHIALEGNHSAPSKRNDLIIDFLNQHLN